MAHYRVLEFSLHFHNCHINVEQIHLILYINHKFFHFCVIHKFNTVWDELSSYSSTLLCNCWVQGYMYICKALELELVSYSLFCTSTLGHACCIYSMWQYNVLVLFRFSFVYTEMLNHLNGQSLSSVCLTAFWQNGGKRRFVFVSFSFRFIKTVR